MRLKFKLAIVSLTAFSSLNFVHAAEVVQTQSSQETFAPSASVAQPGIETPVWVYELADLGPESSPERVDQIKAAYYRKISAISKLGSITQQTTKTDVTFKHINKSQNQDLADLIVNKYKGCSSMNDACKDMIIKLNRKLDMSNIDAALAKGTAGGFTIPVQEWTGSTTFNAGKNYRESQNGNVRTEFYSKALAKALGITPDPFFPKGDSVVEVGNDKGGTDKFITHVVIEDP